MLVAAGMVADAQNVLPLTLDQCIRIALNENPTIKIDSLEIERVDYAKKETLGQLLPDVTFSAQYTRNLALQTIYIDAGHYGSWFASGKKLELSPFFTPDKIDELERFLASSTQRIGDQDFEVDLSKLKLLWSFRKEE